MPSQRTPGVRNLAKGREAPAGLLSTGARITDVEQFIYFPESEVKRGTVFDLSSLPSGITLRETGDRR